MIGAVVLAAGRSRRFGRRAKLTQTIDGIPVLAHTLRALQAQPLRPIVVVTGANHARVEAIVRQQAGRGARVRIRRNPAHAKGMAGSLRAGLTALPAPCDFALIALGDMPRPASRLLARIRQHARAGVDVVRPVQNGRPSHPVAISRRLFDDVRAIAGDRGARDVIAAVPAGRVVTLEAPPRHGVDVDTPQALRALRQRDRGRPSIDTIDKSNRNRARLSFMV